MASRFPADRAHSQVPHAMLAMEITYRMLWMEWTGVPGRLGVGGGSSEVILEVDAFYGGQVR